MVSHGLTIDSDARCMFDGSLLMAPGSWLITKEGARIQAQGPCARFLACMHQASSLQHLALSIKHMTFVTFVFSQSQMASPSPSAVAFGSGFGHVDVAMGSVLMGSFCNP